MGHEPQEIRILEESNQLHDPSGHLRRDAVARSVGYVFNTLLDA